MKIEDVMTYDVVTVGPETSLKVVAEILATRRISGVPVVDGDGTVLGVVSEADIVRREVGEETPGSRLSRILGRGRGEPRMEAETARQAMTSPPITIGPRRDVYEAARLMVERSVNRLPVLEDGKLVGIVARADLVSAFVRPDEEVEHELRDDVLRETLWIDPQEMMLTVEQGVVTLSGELATRADAELVERFASRVPGVVEVRSQLRWRIDQPRLPRSDPHVPRPLRSH